MKHTRVPIPAVEPCVSHVYQGDDGKWWRYCMTCDDGSNKYRRHPRGHNTEADAMMSKRDHDSKKTAVRRWKAWHVLWVDAIIECTTWEDFAETYMEREQYMARYFRVPKIDWINYPVDKREKVMKSIQENFRMERDGEMKW